MKSQDKGHLYLIIASFFGGLIGVLVKLTSGINSYNIVMFRSIIALIFISIILIVKKQIHSLKIVKPINTIFMGIFQGLSILFYFMAVFKTNISNAIFLVYSAPVFSMILSYIFLNERIEKKSLLGLVIVMTGILFIADPTNFSFSSQNSLGNIYALLGGFFYAAMAISVKPLMKKVSPYYITFWQYIIMIIMFLPFYNTSVSTIINNWWQIGIIGVFCTGISHLFFMNGVKKVKGQQIFLVTSLEPFLSSIFAFIILNEIPSSYTLIGGIIIMLGIYIISRKK
ncbi:EamA family transporter [archaeon]|nr:EamA family transporter [archaeon]MBT5423197.1 EamA family transporter [archaeon]MBT6773083.1 EamA family transporter [archaeon]MBT7439889.1 EamA family transporter [archaeon]